MTPHDAFDGIPPLTAVPPPKPRRRGRRPAVREEARVGITREAFMATTTDDDDESDESDEEEVLIMNPEWAMKFAATARARAARAEVRKGEQRARERERAPEAREAERRAEALRARLERLKTRGCDGDDDDGDDGDDVRVRAYGMDGARDVAAAEAETNARFDAWTDARAPEYYPCEPLVRV